MIEMMPTDVADGRFAALLADPTLDVVLRDADPSAEDRAGVDCNGCSATASVAAMSIDQGDRRTVTVVGRLVVRHVGEVRSQLAEALDVDRGDVVVDLTDLEALDTAGLIALTAPLMASRRRGVRVTLVGPRSPEASRTLTLTGLVPLLADTP